MKMADIRCPNCGKDNPEDQEICSFCNADLHPVGETSPAPSDDLTSLFGGEAEEDAIPDWLQELRPEETPDSEEQPALSLGDDSTLDWLETEPQPEQGQESFTAEEDWLSRLDEAQAPPSAQDEETSSDPATELEAWLERDEDDLSWVTDIRASDSEVPSPSDQPEEAEPAVSSAYEDTLDWLSSLETPEAQPESEPEEAVSEQPAVTPQEEPPPQAVPAFDETLFQAGEPVSSGVEELPDWFAESLSETEAGQGELQDAAISPFDEQSFGEEFDQAEQPDWISNLHEEAGTAAQLGAAEEDMPDWLQQVGEGESPFNVTRPAEVPQEAGQADEEEALPLSPFEEAGIEAGLGDQDLPEPVEAAPSEQETGEASFAAMSLEEGEAVPDWLARLDRSESPAEQTGVPAFIMDEESSPFDVDEDISAEAMSELGPQPDWLDQIGAGQELPPIESAADEEEQPSLEPAELPGWLEAMRPSESVPPAGPYRDASDERTEASGLLSGLPGILPGEYRLDRVTRPPVYSIKLHLSQEQQDRVDLLKELLEDESRVAPVRAPAAIPTTYILRLLILGAFILGAIFAFVAGVQQTPVPGAGSIPAEVLDLRRTLDGLSTGVPVLVAFDYQPASLPELETAALPVIDQLIVKGAYLRAVSTNPTGPLLAKHMLERALSMPDRQLLAAPDFANLGYIPGGAAGLQAFVRDPVGLMRYNLDETESGTLDAWQQPVFNPAEGLDNFQLVLVITDNVDTARSWVEQAGQFLQQSNIPLVMVVSAQSEPMIRPYYAGAPRQVAGFASGMMGGVFLESLRDRAGPARLYLDAYSLTLMVAVFLLVIGSLVNLVTGQFLANKKIKGEGQA